MKEYRPIESESLVVAEPAVAYGSAYVQGLKQRLIATIANQTMKNACNGVWNSFIQRLCLVCFQKRNLMKR